MHDDDALSFGRRIGRMYLIVVPATDAAATQGSTAKPLLCGAIRQLQQ